MKLPLVLAAILTLAACASFQQRDDAIFIGTPEDIKYDPAPEMPCGDGHTCVEMQIAVDRFYEVEVLEERDGWVRFTRDAAYHSKQYGWIRKSALAYPEDFQPVRSWAGQSHWNICDTYGCMAVDIEKGGSFKAQYTDSCSIINYQGKCPEYCPFTGSYYTSSCKDWGQLTEFNGIYQLQYRSGMETYLVPVEGEGLCWVDLSSNGKQCSASSPTKR